GGSTNNSVLDLVLGYDGLGRIFGQGPRWSASLGSLLEAISGASSAAGAAAGPGGAGFGGQPGLLRLFDTQVAGEIRWLLAFAAGVDVGLGGLRLGLAVMVSVLRLLPRRLALPTHLAGAALAAGAAAVLLGPAAFAVDNVAKSVSGPIPSSGPSSAVPGQVRS